MKQLADSHDVMALDVMALDVMALDAFKNSPWKQLHLCCLAILLGMIACNPAVGQESPLTLLPKQEGIYLWTNDVQTLLVDAKQALVPGESALEQLAEFAQRQRRNSDGNLAQSRDAEQLLSRLARMNTLWSTLHDDELFSGHALLILPTASMAEASPAEGGVPITYGRNPNQPSVSGWNLVLQTTKSKEEIAEFLMTVKRMNDEDAEADRPDTDEGDAKLPGAWDCEEGWFCWTPSDEETVLTLDHLHGRTTTKQTLANDRNFRTVFGNLPTNLAGNSPLSIYVTAEALPFVAWQLADNASILSSVRYTDWRTLFLDELRGLGTRVYLSDELFPENLSASFGIDAFLLMTQPRRGPFAALGASTQPGIDYDLPTLSLPLSELVQFSVDGERLLTGVMDTQERANAENPNPSGRQIPEDDPNMQILKLFSRFCEMQFDSDAAISPEQGGISPRVMMLKPSDIDTLVEQLETLADGSLSPLNVREIDSPLGKLPSERVKAWGRSEQSLEQIRSNFNQGIQSMEASIEQFESSNDENAQANIASLKQSIKMQRESLERLESQVNQPQAVMIDSWIIASGMGNDTFQQSLVDGFDDYHPQMLELQDNVRDLKEAFGNRRPEVAVMSLWAPRLISRARSFNNRPENVRAIVATPEFTKPDSEPQVDFIAELVTQQLDKLLFTMSSSDDGFRINGALLRSRPRD